MTMLPLPPANLRMNSASEKDDTVYLRSAKTLVAAIRSCLEVDRFSAVKRGVDKIQDMFLLDFGCGTSRLLHGLDDCGCAPKKYVGVDIQGPQIAWCTQYLSPAGDYHFQLIDAQNDRYNPGGKKAAGNLIDERFIGADLVVVRSVLTHMRAIEAYQTLSELRRAVKDDGRVYLTVNVKNSSVPWTDKTDDREDGFNLLKVQFNKGYFENMLEEMGFTVAVFSASMENQCVYLLRPE